MAGRTATTLAYVRTGSGVVTLVAGEDVPEDVLPSEVDRLLRHGSIVPAVEAEPIVVTSNPRSRKLKDTT